MAQKKHNLLYKFCEQQLEVITYIISTDHPVAGPRALVSRAVAVARDDALWIIVEIDSWEQFTIDRQLIK